MERSILNDLVAWNNRPDRKPLILLGARQSEYFENVLHDFQGI